MNERISELQQEVKKLDVKIENADLKKQVLQARYRRKENEIRSRERKQRAHRLIGIGAEVESVMGRQIAKEELPAFREYMKRAEMVMFCCPVWKKQLRRTGNIRPFNAVALSIANR